MVSSQRVELLVGPLASGKSTYSARAAAKGFVIVSDDAIVNVVHGGVYTLYDPALKPLYKSTENHLLTTAIAMGRSVVVDRGLNCSKASRERWIAIARSMDVPCEAVVFKDEGPEVHAKRRAEADGRGISEEGWLWIAKAHKERYSCPTLSEGFKEVRFVSWNAIQKGDLW